MSEPVPAADRAVDKAILGAQWATLAVPELSAAIRALSGVGTAVARDIAERPASYSDGFILATQSVDDAWNACTKALKIIARARESLVDAREGGS